MLTRRHKRLLSLMLMYENYQDEFNFKFYKWTLLLYLLSFAFYSFYSWMLHFAFKWFAQLKWYGHRVLSRRKTWFIIIIICL
jgi:hypothetical protein